MSQNPDQPWKVPSLESLETYLPEKEGEAYWSSTRPIDELNEKRDVYIERKNLVESEFLAKPPTREYLTVSNLSGNDVLVHTSAVTCNIPEHLQRPDKKTTNPDDAIISIFLPGMFAQDIPNMGNHPLEAKLCGALITGDCDAVMMLKAEGTVPEAYDGKGHKTVSEAALITFKKQLLQFLELPQNKGKKNIKIRIAGFSEGAIQGVSLAARIHEYAQEILAANQQGGTNEMGERRSLELLDFTSLGGDGLCENQDQSSIDLLDLKDRILQGRREGKINRAEIANATGPYKQIPVEDSEQTVSRATEDLELLNSGITRTRVRQDLFQGYEQALGEHDPGIAGKLRADVVDPAKMALGDFSNIVPYWLTRFVATAAGLDDSGKLSAKEVPAVPFSRVQATFTYSPEYEYLLNQGVHVTVLAGDPDEFYPSRGVSHCLIAMADRNPRIAEHLTYITSDITHAFPHSHASGVAYFLELMQDKWEEQQAQLK